MKYKHETFDEKLNMYIEHDDARAICSLIANNFYTKRLAKDDEELQNWFEMSYPTWCEQIKKANIELQKRLPKYIGNANTEGDLMEKLEAIEPKYNDTCVQSWYDEINSVSQISEEDILWYIDKYILLLEHIPFGKYEYVYIAETNEDVKADDFYSFRKQVVPIALAYANEELLRRLDRQLGEMTDVSKDNNNTK